MQTLKNIMTKSVEVVSPNATLAEVAQRMKRQDVGVLPVCDGRRIQGMVTDRDIVTRALAENRDPKQVRVSEVMTKDVHYCYEDDTIQDAADLMQKRQIRRLIVVDKERNLSGIVSLGDLAIESGKDKLVSKTLEEVSSPGGSAMYNTNLSRKAKNSPWLYLALGSSFFLGAVFFFGQRPEFRDRLKKVIPLDRIRKKAA